MNKSAHWKWWIVSLLGGWGILSCVWGQPITARRNECAIASIPYEMSVDEHGIPGTLVFGTAVDFDTIGYPIERVHVELVRENRNGECDTAIFHYVGMWQMKYKDTTAGKWARMLAPKDVWSDTNAVGKVGSGCFWGQVDVDADYKMLSVHTVVRRIGAGPLIGEWKQTVNIVPERLKIPYQKLAQPGFDVIPDTWNTQYLIKGTVKPSDHLSIYMVDDMGQLVGVVEEGEFSGKYRKVINYGNALVRNYLLHVRIGDSLQVLPMPRYGWSGQ